ncbi:mitochondrial transcription rescue factor 1-like isoform X2 [Tachypleus tridentatus]|uniref:mitochondrial transcription rescue factor 1-like isoform X2 n=1 Tax=Tachypleus tridentatus TaxID=6853 RepID=UPI003FD3AC81
MSRSKVEEVFYESRIRVNGKKMLKKSTQMQVGNEIDWIKGVNSENENFLNISRVIVQRIENRGETEKMQVVLRRFKNMVIENYDTPWNNSTAD